MRAHRTAAHRHGTHERVTLTVPHHLPRVLRGRPAPEDTALEEPNRLRLPPHRRLLLPPEPVPVPEPQRPVVGETGRAGRMARMQSVERRERKPSQRGSRERRALGKRPKDQRGTRERPQLCVRVWRLRRGDSLAQTRQRHSAQTRPRGRTRYREHSPIPGGWVPNVCGHRHQREQAVLEHTSRVDPAFPRWKRHTHRATSMRERCKRPSARRAQRSTRARRDQASVAYAYVNRLAQPVNLYLTQRMRWMREGSAGKHG